MRLILIVQLKGIFSGDGWIGIESVIDVTLRRCRRLIPSQQTPGGAVQAEVLIQLTTECNLTEKHSTHLETI